MENIINIVKGLGVTRIIILAGSLLLMLALFAAIIFKSNQSPMVLLYGGVDAKEASAISSRLASQGVKYEVKPNGSVYVQQDKVGEMRLLIAGEGLVGASSTGYEIFDKNSSFGTTSLVQNINARRALEGELARTISSMPIVSSARVHLVLPKKKLFSREKIKPTASITVNIGNRILNDEQIQSITHLVAASIPNLTPDNVTVVDTRGNLLSSGKRSAANVANTHAKIRRGIELDYENAITRMMEKVVGANKASVKVTAEMDFDRIEENSELYDPEQQVVRSEQRSEDNSSSRSSNNNVVGAASNIPGQEVGGGGNGSEQNSNRAEETINYEISKTIRNYVREGGVVKRLSVAVLVEGKYKLGEDGTETYVPYSSLDIEKFKTLIETSIGYDEDRGDVVEIVDMAFNAPLNEDAEEETSMFSKEDYFRMAEYGLMFLGIFFLFFFVIKPILKSAEKASNPDLAKTAVGAAMTGSTTENALSTAGGEGGETSEESMIDLAKVEGKVKESSVKKVVEIIDQYPEESVGVIRSWMSSSSSGS